MGWTLSIKGNITTDVSKRMFSIIALRLSLSCQPFGSYKSYCSLLNIHFAIEVYLQHHSRYRYFIPIHCIRLVYVTDYIVNIDIFEWHQNKWHCHTLVFVCVYLIVGFYDQYMWDIITWWSTFLLNHIATLIFGLMAVYVPSVLLTRSTLRV